MEKREFSEDERIKGERFKQCISDNGYSMIADILTDEASYDMMYCLNWLAAGPLNTYDTFSKQYELARQLSEAGNNQMMDDFNQGFLSRSKYYLELSGQDEAYIQEQTVPFARLLMKMYCDSEALCTMFKDYFEKNKVKVNQ
ncbi:MAG: hypothetical protein IJR82_05755 [Bacilli bacterium]|nr:hypothetical protein [Bacilli bacterium]